MRFKVPISIGGIKYHVPELPNGTRIVQNVKAISHFERKFYSYFFSNGPWLEKVALDPPNAHPSMRIGIKYNNKRVYFPFFLIFFHGITIFDIIVKTLVNSICKRCTNTQQNISGGNFSQLEWFGGCGHSGKLFISQIYF